jgi:LCP family protein required for cell wall assembly
MFRLPGGITVSAKAGYMAACAAAALTLVTSGIACAVQSQLGAFGGGSSVVGGSSTGPMNILLMGLESRTDFDGNILPPQLLAAMHAGSVRGVENGVGGNDANTLILLHIFAGGQRAVAFSIPRDDFVTLKGTRGLQNVGKADQAYGTAMLAEEDTLIRQDPGISQNDKMRQANIAGQAAEIETVENLTGVQVNHFAVINLEGFYELAQAFNGVEVCLKSWDGGKNLHDANSGFSQPTPGYHLLDAAQALAFVRERDNLPNGDLDRTHRQQAVLDYVIWKLEHQGALSDVGALSSLLSTAKKYLITDPSWNLLQFGSEMKSLTGSRVKFQTLPVKSADGQVTLGGVTQTVNLVDPGQIKDLVNQAFYGNSGTAGPQAAGQSSTSAGGGKSGGGKHAPNAPAVPARDVTVDVYNGGYTTGLAAEVARAIPALGFKAGTVGNAPSQQANTEVLYGTGTAASASKVAGDLGVSAAPSSTVPTGHVQVVLGSTTTSVPPALDGATGSGSSAGTGSSGSIASSAGSASSGGAASSGSGAGNPAGGAVTVNSGARFGIPCVY